VDYARVNKIDLIAMSTHGRSGFNHLIFGSVAEKVLHTSHGPILLIHPPQEGKTTDSEQPQSLSAG
jgi:nucleotide-binding universal stress UspA family protein